MEFWQTVGATLVGGGILSVVFTALVGAWFAIQLEKFKGKQNAKMEEIKAELGVLSKLQAQSIERQATIAAQVLVATLRYLDALRSSVTVMVQGTSEKTDTPVDALKADLEFRWAALRPFEKEFLDIWIQAEVHLPEDASAILSEVSECGNTIYGAQFTHLTMFTNRSPYPPAFKNGFGEVPQKRIDELREKALAKLRPLVKLDLHSAIKAATLPNKAMTPTGAGEPAG